MIWVLALCLAVAVESVQARQPVFANSFIAKGTIELPYAEIVEPFSAAIDGRNDRSRISTYDGLSNVFKLGQVAFHGVVIKEVYETTDTALNRLACFKVHGKAADPVHMQSVIPDLSKKYEYWGQEECGRNGELLCDTWVYQNSVGAKDNKYVFRSTTVDGVDVPVEFHFRGYDRLFGSHFDEYKVQYDEYQPVDRFSDELFEPTVSPCTGFPGPGLTATSSIFERLHASDEKHEDEIDVSFKSFKEKHGKQYTSDKEHFERSRIYRANHHFVESMNRRKLTYRLKLNHLADLKAVERKIMRGLKRAVDSMRHHGAKEFKPRSAPATIPMAYDWRIYGAVTPVKDQAICGSCWSFSTTGVIEGAYFIKHGKQIMLSQQNMMDCTWGEGNNGCDGGEQYRAYKWIMKHGGIATSDSYGPYLMEDGKCHFANATVGTTIASYVYTKSGSEVDLRMALLEQPVAVNIDASHESFSFYSSGVYYEPKCGNTANDLDHAVLAVGFGTLDGEDFWIVKNSWSTHWGNAGFVLMSRHDNNCGVATEPTFVRL